MKSEHQKIFLDYSSTTPVDPAVVSAMMPYFSETFGNASSAHAYGRNSKNALEESRARIAHTIGAEVGEIFFTSGGTEADNHALIGSALAEKKKTGRNHVIVSAIEHHAVLHSAEYLRTMGFQISYARVNANGVVDLDALKEIITPRTSVVSIMHANNEVGTFQPIDEIAKLTRAYHCIFHSDTVQTIGKIPIDVRTFPVHLLAISAHKFYGPKGIGTIYIRKGTELDPLLHGGAQERNQRAGTENIPLVVGLAAALQLSHDEMERNTLHVKKLKERLTALLVEHVQGLIINGRDAQTLDYILNVSLDSKLYSLEAETLLLGMDLRGVAVSSGAACTSGSIQPSHVLLAMGRDEKTTQMSIRFSFGKNTTIAEVEHAGEIFYSFINSLSKK